MRFGNELTALAFGVALATATSALAAAPGEFDITLKPMRTEAGKVDRVQVAQRIEGVAAADGQPLTLVANVAIFGTPAVADRITGLEAKDADGAIPLKAEDDKPAPGGAGYYRRWKAQRPVKFPVTVSYSAAVQPDGVGSGPAYGLRPSGGGVAAMGSGFLLLPLNAGTTATNLHWDLSGLPAGSLGVINAGEGDVTLKGPASALSRQWILAGPAGRYAPPTDIPFTGYWLGKPPFEPQAEMAWTAKTYGVLTKHFAYLNPAPPYRVFIKMLDSPPYGGGSAGPGAFLMSMAEGRPRDDARGTFFHEMAHQWVGSMEGPHAGWFNEGFTVHTTTTLQVKSGLQTPTDYLAEVNKVARSYYTTKAAKLSMAEIDNIGFGDEQVRQAAYTRGAIYWAQVDGQIRARSGGKRNLDSLILPMMAARKATPMTVASWEAAIGQELGPQAVADFHAEVMEGTKVAVPPSDAYGPCFRRVEAEMVSNIDQAKITGYQWERVASVPDTACGKF